MLLAAHFSPVPTVLPEFLPATAVSVTTPILEDLDHVSEPQFPVANDGQTDEGPVEAALTNADTFKLHSKPGSRYTIFMDFDGGITEGTAWNNSTGIETLIDIAYTRNSDSSSFTNSELSEIRNLWKLVAEDYAPFDVDVTTEDPGLDALTKSGSGDTTWGIRSLHTTNTNKVCASCGGVAYIGSFSSSIDLPAYSFNKGVSAGGNTQSHEVGHSVRLGHDGLSTGTTYYAGHGSGNTTWGPIMGGPGSRKLKTWSNGDYYNANNTQDDLDRITSLNGFSYRADDHGNTFAVATPLEIAETTNFTSFGIIEQNNDVDLFSFETVGGNVSFEIHPYLAHPNLDLWAGIYDSAGSLLAQSNRSDNVSASFTDVALGAGKFFLKIEGVGSHGFYNASLDRVFDPGEPDYTGPETDVPWAVPSPTGYSDYGSVGQYWISGTRSDVAVDRIAIAPDNSVRAEGDSDATPFTFVVTRSGNLEPAVEVAYSVVAAVPEADNNNYAFTVEPNDFGGAAFPSGTVTIEPGQPSAVLTVMVAGDTEFERDELFRVILSDPQTGWTIEESTAEGTVLSDESAVGIASLNTAMIAQDEGDPLSGGAVHTYTLVRHGDTSGTTTADWQVEYSGFSDPASDADFVNGLRPQGQVTFTPGVTQIDVDVIVSGDLEVEGDESFSIVVTGVSGAGVALVDPARSSRRGIILEDESPVTVIDEVQFRWRQIRHSGGTRDVWAIDNVSLSDSGFADDFDPDIENSQWASIQNGAVNGSGSIFPGSNGQELLMSGTGDRIATSVAATPISGAVLTFDLIIGNGTGSSGNGADNAESGKDIWLEYSVDGQYWDVLKKMDTDDYEQWSTVNVTLPDRTAVTPKVIDEGDSGTTSMTLNLVRTGNLSKPATADWMLVPTGTNAIDIDDLDGTAFPSGTVNFAVDDGVEAVTIPIRGDTAFESAETFELVVTGTTGGPITGGPRVATILNDDALGVDGVELNDGSAQRSKVTEVHVRFNALVDAQASAFSLTNLGTPQQPQNVPVTDLAITFADVGASTVVTIRRTTGQSLADGEYRLDIDGSMINVRGGSILMGSGYAFGDQAADNFFRKYGDNDGNRAVDLFDFADFRSTFGRVAGDAGYIDPLDFDENQTINLFDFAAFRANFGT